MLKSIKIPFTGFYESDHDAMINDEINMLFETDDSGGNYAAPDNLYKHAEYGNMYQEYAKLYTGIFADKFEELTGIKLALEFDELKSPREYNFETDKIFAKVSFETIKAMREYVGLPQLRQCIIERHSSRSGFHSFYSNDPQEWENKPIDEWDEIELETLIFACLDTSGTPFDDDEFFAYNLMDQARGNGAILSLVTDNISSIMLDFADYQRAQGKECNFEQWEKDKVNV